MYDLVALGESLIDFTPAGKNRQNMNLFSQNPGGAPANVLAMAAKLGSKTAFIGKVGQDDFGDFLQKNLEAVGINCAGLCRDAEIPTTLAFVQLDDKGDRSFTFYRKPGADILLKQQELPLELLQQCRIFHFGSVSLTDEPSRSTTLFAAQRAKEAGAIISYDPNYRPFLWRSVQQAKDEILAAMPMADILKVSEEELALLTEETDLTKGAQWLSQRGPKAVFITLGAGGVYFYTPVGAGKLPTFDVKTVDTNGAGDAFWGTLLAGLLKAEKTNLAEIELAYWKQISNAANAAGSLTTTQKGAIPAMPNQAQIEACIKNTPFLAQA